MNHKREILLLVTLLAALLYLAACQWQPATQEVQVEVTRVVTEVVVEEGEAVEVTRLAQPQEEPSAQLAATPATTAVAGRPASEPAVPQQRLVIKDGRMTITVQDTETAVNRATQLAVEMGGYILSQEVHDDERGYRFATMRLAVPVDRFEEALRTLRGLGDVSDESASGTDVTDEYVDLNSRLTNLEATRDRLRTFLDQATDVEQTLRVNEELKKVEEEIAIIQGRLNYLRDRAAFSTIDLTLNPLVPTPTPTATPTATPLPTAEVWQPGNTARVAAIQLQETAQETADFTIYNAIVWGPWLLLLLLVGYVVRWVLRRLQRQEDSLVPETSDAGSSG
jgi:hypothetical protein